mmetsp:Transcript_66878/g.145853  ORF Transcript_66878/g.145853 Transcript_66878/m.145853 type:complete len:495 (-) Transcript_66878:131-1615(-)
MPPAAKKPRVEVSEPKEAQAEDEEMAEKKEEETAPEEERETDAPADTRPKIKEPVVFHLQESTLNVMPSTFGNVLTTLSDGGLQYLLAGARSSVGLKSGRYMFEAKIIEFINPPEDPAVRSRTPQPRNVLRVGVALPGSSLFLGDTEDSVCFDADGHFIHNKKKVATEGKFTRDDVVAVLVNLEETGENSFTISLFKNGVRACAPQPLPESMRGQALHPAVTFKNLALHVNFGPVASEPLPFKCRMVQDAAAKDVVTTAITPPKDGKYEVLFPVSMPDEGSFDWLDLFLEKNPTYTELSDRAILRWAEKSGLYRPKGFGQNSRSSNDKPEFGFGLPLVDDLSISKVLRAVTPIHLRNYVVMEVQSNLIKEHRKELLPRWSAPHFKKVAIVMVGDPTPAFKKRSQELILQAKQEASDAEHKAKMAAEKQKKMMEKRAKELEKVKKRAEKQKKKAEEERKKKVEEDKKKLEEEKRKKEEKLGVHEVADEDFFKDFM